VVPAWKRPAAQALFNLGHYLYSALFDNAPGVMFLTAFDLRAMYPGLHFMLLVLALVSSAPAFAADPDSGEFRNIVVLGDSLAAGYGLDPSLAFPALLQKRIDDAGWKFHIINAGVSGDTSAGGLRRLDWLLKRPVDILVLELGGNDGLRGLPAEALKKNLQTIVERTREKYPGAQIVLAGMKMPLNLGQYAVDFERVYVDLAKEQDLALVPFLLEGVGGKVELNLPDRIHPTAEGHKILADNVWAVLKPLLARNGAPSERVVQPPARTRPTG
jgi:acyl-CoA thioesterase-1